MPSIYPKLGVAGSEPRVIPFPDCSFDSHSVVILGITTRAQISGGDGNGGEGEGETAEGGDGEGEGPRLRQQRQKEEQEQEQQE